jgi:hypothetical protein
MDLYTLIWFGILLAFYGVPFAVGLCVSRWRTSVLLAMASFAGLYVSVWSTLGPLFLPLAVQLLPRFELVGVLALSFASGALQSGLVATLGYGTKLLFFRIVARSTSASSQIETAKS